MIVRLVAEYRKGPNTWGPGQVIGGLPEDEIARLIEQGIAVPVTTDKAAKETR